MQDIASLHPDVRWFVPLGMKQWFSDTGVYNVVEMDWSEKVRPYPIHPYTIIELNMSLSYVDRVSR